MHCHSLTAAYTSGSVIERRWNPESGHPSLHQHYCLLYTLNAPMNSCLCSPFSTCCVPSAAPPVPTGPLLRGPAFLPSRRLSFSRSLSASLDPALADLGCSLVLVDRLQLPDPNLTLSPNVVSTDMPHSTAPFRPSVQPIALLFFTPSPSGPPCGMCAFPPMACVLSPPWHVPL